MQTIARIEEYQILSTGIGDGLVHGVIKPGIMFANQANMVRMRSARILGHIALHYTQRGIGGAPVHDEVLYAGVILPRYALQCSLQRLRSIVSDCSNGYQRYLRLRRRHRAIGRFQRR